MKSLKQRHHRMVSDQLRTPLLQEAIRQIVKKGNTVFDLGCGTGILSFESIQAGAKQVFACDIDPHLKETLKDAGKKGFDDQICFFPSLSSDVYLMDKVDVLIAETVGSLGLDENIVPFVIDARKRLLKKEGKIIPAKMTVFVAPVILPPPPLRGRGWGEGAFTTRIIKPDSLLAKPQIYAQIDFKKVKDPFFDNEVTFKITRDGNLNGFAGWFEVTWAPGLVTRTSPWDAPTHWEQGILRNDKVLKMKKGNNLLFRLRLFPKDELFSTESAIEWGFEKS